MRKRLRKKKHIREFQEFGFKIRATFHNLDLDKDVTDKFTDDLIHFVEAQNATLGGSPVSFYTLLNQQSRLSYKERLEKSISYRTNLIAWFFNHPLIAHVEASHFNNPWT